MCKCTPGIRTPYCGRGECKWPVVKEDLTTGVSMPNEGNWEDMFDARWDHRDEIDSFMFSGEGIGKNRVKIKDFIRSLLSQQKKNLIEKIKKEMSCEECNGSGVHCTPSDYSPCKNCNGTGYNLDISSFNDTIKELEK